MWQPAERRIPSLDGLRAISIALVLVGHLAGTQFSPISREVGRFWNFGDFGVRVFFVISGFLITGLLLDEMARHGRVRLGRFYFRRTLRIFPPYYAYLAAMFAAATYGLVELAPRDALHTVSYTSNYYPERSWYMGHTWSLSVEEQFYLLWPAALLLAGVRRGLWIAAAVVVLLPLVRLFEWHFVPSAASGIGHRFETVADAIAVGCLLAGTREALHRWPLYMRALASPFFVVVPMAAVAGALTHDYPNVSFFAGMTLTNVCVALTIDWCVTFHDGRVGRVLNAAPLVFVGWISYSLYLWQQPFLNRASTADVASFPLNLALAFAFALASYALIERPSLALRRWIEPRWFKSEGSSPERPQPAPAVASLALVAVLAGGAFACAPRGPIIDTGEQPPRADGTISGVVREAGSNAPMSARRVTAVGVEGGQRFEASTAVNGGYTLKVPPGTYRMEVELREGETLVEGPGDVTITRSDMDADRDFLIARKQAFTQISFTGFPPRGFQDGVRALVRQ